MSMTTRSCVPVPMDATPSVASILNSMRRPTTLVTRAPATTSLPTGVAAKCRTSTRVPTALCCAPRKGLIALRAAFSMAMIMTGVAKTGGKVASLKRLARCSAVTTSVNEPLAPTGIDAMRLLPWTCRTARTVQPLLDARGRPAIESQRTAHGITGVDLLLSFLGPVTVLPAIVLGVLAGVVAYAEDEALPPRTEWRASSSSGAQPTMLPAFAIDGDASTKWGGAFSPGHWLQVDLSRTAAIGGALIHWDSAFAAAYLILSSEDWQHWQTAYETTDSQGGMDYVSSPAVHSGSGRWPGAPSTCDWGVRLFEFEPLAVSESPRITGLEKGDDPAALWSAQATGKLVDTGPVPGTRELHVTLPRALPVSGLEVFWGSARGGARLEGRRASGKWERLAEDPLPLGDSSYLAAREARSVGELRLTVRAAPGRAPAIRRLRLLSPTQAMTTMKRYEIVASRAHRELFPSSLHSQQVYWTAVGVPAARRKSVLDEYGDLEAFKGAPLVQPLWRDRSGRTAAAYDASVNHTLRKGWMPMPAVQWSPQPGLLLRSEAIAADQAAGPVTFVRHRLANTGKSRVDGQLAIVVRPMQVDPPWQHGGVSPIRAVKIGGTRARSTVNVNGRTLLTSLPPATARGAAPFGLHGEDEITRYVAAGQGANG